jgi:hypothetical protein
MFFVWRIATLATNGVSFEHSSVFTHLLSLAGRFRIRIFAFVEAGWSVTVVTDIIVSIACVTVISVNMDQRVEQCFDGSHGDLKLKSDGCKTGSGVDGFMECYRSCRLALLGLCSLGFSLCDNQQTYQG